MTQKNLFTMIPKVDELLEKENIKRLLNHTPRSLIVNSIRSEVEILRSDIKDKMLNESTVMDRVSSLESLIVKRIEKKNTNKLKSVINATGVVIHTNLGRSLLNEKIIDNIRNIALNYSNLEYDLGEGSRGSRYSHLEDIIKDITGGEASIVVNNNAAAVMLVLNTIAKNKEVIVSRGELIEIGGSFRIPDVMEQSGAYLKEVGTTNKTHLSDYEKAINENTAALLKVHTSNYRILGFTSSVDSGELFNLKNKHQIPLIEDIGSGVLIDLSKYGLEYEKTVSESLKNGVDIVTFSGDKLLGGPQAGIIVGKKEYIDAMKRNPLTRALRIDKFTIAALETTLKYYIDEEDAIKKIPTLNMLTMGINEIEKKAIKLMEIIHNKIIDDSLKVSLEDGFSEVGGGSLPLEKLPTKCIVLNIEGFSTQKLERSLREFKTPIITRLYKDKVYIDLRTIDEKDFEVLADGIVFAIDNVKGVL